MEQPKFRGFSRETNTWQYGHGWFNSDYTEEYKQEKGISDQAVLYTEGYPVECELSSMGQFTGLRDKYEKEIWAGDIVKVRGNLIRVKFPEFNEFCVASSIYPSYREVVGNTVETPDLIKGGF